jgi:hypothetical protein
MDGYINLNEGSSDELDFVPTRCPKCYYSPIPGMIPVWYTPEQYRDWIRRENNLPDYELPGDMPVWVSPNPQKYVWAKYDYGHRNSELDDIQYYIVVRTEAGCPPADWSSE